MLHILLLILKIIGIILLVILALILLILATVLLVPLRYRLSGSGAGDLKSLQGNVRFSWLLHLVSGYAKYENQKLDWNVRIAWKWLGPQAEEPVPQYEEKTDGKDEAAVIKGTSVEDVKEEKIVTAQEIHENVEPSKLEQPKEEPTIEESPKEEPSIEELPIEEPPKEESLKVEPKEEQSKIKETKLNRPKKQIEEENDIPKESIFKKIQAVFEKIKYTFEKICDNIKSLTATKDKLEEFITDEVHKAALSRGIREVKRLLRFLKPKKFHLNAHIGFEDPSITGKMLAGLSILYPFVGKNHLCVKPEFEEVVYEGDLMIRGHIRVVYFIIIGIHLILDKNVRMTYKHIKNFKK